ncbi:peptidoglycan-binding protein [Chelativorans sp. Marseille-P2723]|uniref:peptidoglycan-binding domain-containing protein n=1 Tax=Chelativorans sp. Marseille-P2723 TaxID=2709133 RepID=UPI0015705F4C|nr:peptidoglycan-binding protein [Chelativorans sp. Marseille-P2723]
MKRNARRHDRSKSRWRLLHAAASVIGDAIGRNPVAVGGTTAFLVSLAFVSANALFYQPQTHPSAFVVTRGSLTKTQATPSAALPDDHPLPSAAPERQSHWTVTDEQAIPLPTNEATGSVPPAAQLVRIDEGTIRAVQKTLADLGLYPGPIDGMTGPQTDAAIQSYRRIVGLEAGNRIDGALLRQLGLNEFLSPAADSTAERRKDRANRSDSGMQMASNRGDVRIQRVQAGLKAFGNDGIDVDGVMGEKTRKAIQEFQSLFGLPVTGQPDEALYSKMQEIGLIR